MGLITNIRMYNCTIIVKGMVNKSDIQLLAYNYVQFLKKLGANNIVSNMKNEYRLSYPIQKIDDVTFIEFSFSVVPKALEELIRKIRLDELILRYFLVRKN